MNLESSVWLHRHLELAREVSSWSKDDSTKVGALIVTKEGKPVSWGYNGIPMGVKENLDRTIRPVKYHYFAHAERNALDLSRSSVEDCWMFVTHPPCSDCARGIIQTGISTVVIDIRGIDDFADRRGKDWFESVEHSMQMFGEAGVRVIYFDMVRGVTERHAITTRKERVCL